MKCPSKKWHLVRLTSDSVSDEIEFLLANIAENASKNLVCVEFSKQGQSFQSLNQLCPTSRCRTNGHYRTPVNGHLPFRHFPNNDIQNGPDPARLLPFRPVTFRKK